MTDVPLPLNEKIAIVTGAGSGVGRATAVALAAAGAIPVLVGRRADALHETATLIATAGGQSLVIPTDITAETAVARLIDRVTSDLGGIDILINAAGIGRYGPVATYSLTDWQTTLATNLTAVFLCSRAVLPSMSQRGGGAILSVASGAGKQGYPNLSAYAASKFGLIGFMQSLAAEVGEAGIKVSTVLPGSILTDFAGGSAAEKRANPDGKRYLEPEDVAAAMLFLLQQPRHAWTQELNLWPF